MIKKFYMKRLEEKVQYYASIYHFDMSPDGKTSYNNEGDAFKHCMSQAELTYWFGDKIAKFIGDLQEKNNLANNKAKETMDKWNNEQGRLIVKEVGKQTLKSLNKQGKMYDKIAEEIMKKMREDKLITNPEEV